MAEEKQVQVKLAARCHVDKEIREKDEIVSLPESIAEHFGEIVDDAKPKKTATEK